MRIQSRWARVARGSAAAVFATLTAAVSHGLARGVPPSAFGVAVSLGLSVMLCTLLAGRTLSTVRLTVAIAITQLLFHALFSGLGAPVAANHLHSPGRIDALTVTHDHGAMWLAHVAAGLVTLLVFRYGEVAFWGVAGLARLLVTRLVRRVIPNSVPWMPRVAPRAPIAVRPLAVVVSPMTGRGPPQGCLAV